jgi:hypothetical protein
MLLHIVAMHVRVPTVAVAGVEVHRDVTHACLYQTPREQHGLAEQVATVLIAQRGRFLANIERAAGFLGSSQRPSPRLKLVHRCDGRMIAGSTELVFKLRAQRLAASEAVKRQVSGER